MFIVEPIKKEEATGELKILYKMIEKVIGFIPPHFELFASIDIEDMKDFLNYNVKMMNHQRIDKDILPFLRLDIAKRECRNYCINFNTQILKSRGIEDIDVIPLDEKQITLMKKILKAIYRSNEFTQEDIYELEKIGFKHKDFFDLLNYATNFMAKSKMIEVYTK